MKRRAGRKTAFSLTFFGLLLLIAATMVMEGVAPLGSLSRGESPRTQQQTGSRQGDEAVSSSPNSTSARSNRDGRVGTHEDEPQDEKEIREEERDALKEQREEERDALKEQREEERDALKEQREEEQEARKQARECAQEAREEERDDDDDEPDRDEDCPPPYSGDGVETASESQNCEEMRAAAREARGESRRRLKQAVRENCSS